MENNMATASHLRNLACHPSFINGEDYQFVFLQVFDLGSESAPPSAACVGQGEVLFPTPPAFPVVRCFVIVRVFVLFVSYVIIASIVSYVIIASIVSYVSVSKNCSAYANTMKIVRSVGCLRPLVAPGYIHM